MKKFKLIYNPLSGGGAFKGNIDKFIQCMQKNGYEVSVFRTCEIGDIESYIANLTDEPDAIGVSGGDGTINLVVNSIMRHKLNHIPLALIPSGTANDFCSYLGIPRDIEECCDMIGRGKIIKADIGLINNERYFVNVCAGGLFSNVSQEVDKTFKDIFGKLAYYLKGMEQLSTFKPIPMRITTSKGVTEDNINLFLVLNSSGTGGIENISPDASINDGLLDFVAFANTPWPELTKTVMDFFKGEHLTSDGVIYFKDSYIKVENLSPDGRFTTTDIDGERGPEMPVEIKIAESVLRIFA